jgi:anti-sigma factor RsiW
MLLKYLRYRYVKARMTAYLDGELPTQTRRFIARQIDENPLCYQEYIRSRQAKQALERDLPTFGRAGQSQLDNIWANIQSELKAVDSVGISRPRRLSYSWAYGFAALMMALILLAPFALDARHLGVSNIPKQPLPEIAATQTSPAQTASVNPTSVAFAQDTEVQSTDDLSAELQNTPVPNKPRQ